MEEVYTMWSKQPDEKNKDEHRLLRKLKIALLIWLLSFILTLIWFTFSPGS